MTKNTEIPTTHKLGELKNESNDWESLFNPLICSAFEKIRRKIEDRIVNPITDAYLKASILKGKKS